MLAQAEEALGSLGAAPLLYLGVGVAGGVVVTLLVALGVLIGVVVQTDYWDVLVENWPAIRARIVELAEQVVVLAYLK